MSGQTDLETALCKLRDQRNTLVESGDAAFQAWFEALRHWQSRHVAARHLALAHQHGGKDLLYFLTRTFYLEADWSELTQRPEQVAKQVGRIIDDDRPLVAAIELQATADELDATMAQALLNDAGNAELTPYRYVRAFRATGQRAQREYQLTLLNELIDLLGGYADNRGAYWAFKLSSAPARALGLGHTYALLADGFAAMRATWDIRTASRAAVAVQHQLLARLLP